MPMPMLPCALRQFDIRFRELPYDASLSMPAVDSAAIRVCCRQLSLPAAIDAAAAIASRHCHYAAITPF